MSLENRQIISKEVVVLPKFRPAKIFNQKAKKKLKRLVNNKDGVSQRKLASRFKWTQQHVGKVIKALGIKKLQKAKDSGPNR